MLLHGSLRIARVLKRVGKGRKREIVGLRRTQRRHNCERRRVTRVGSLGDLSLISPRCGICICATGFYTEPLRYLCNRECVGIPFPLCLPHTTFQYVVHTRCFCSHEISASRRLLVEYRCNFPPSYEGSCRVPVSLEFYEIIFFLRHYDMRESLDKGDRSLVFPKIVDREN